MHIIYKRKYITIFAKLFLFVFSFAWITCNSHVSFLSSTSGPITHHEESSRSHNESCIDHTQVFSRSQGSDYHADFSYIPATPTSLDFSLVQMWKEMTPPHLVEIDSGQRLFLQNKVLRI